MKRMKHLSARIITFALSVASILTIGTSASVSAATSNSIQSGINAAHGTGQPTELFGDAGVITAVTNTLLFIVGALSVIMIIWGGIRYATSGGNASSVTAAKNTILYALVGLIIAFLAFAAINWVLGALMAGTDASFSNQ